jgi:enoyl-[acyl-carrier protein] reductase I
VTSSARPVGFGLEGRRVAVLGVADGSSIAWGIATAFAAEGASVTVGYQQRFFSRVRLLLREWPGIEGERCDVLSDGELETFFSRFDTSGLDVVVHAVAFGPPEVFTAQPSNVSDEAFAETLAVSAHSLARVVRFAAPRLRESASVITLSFQAAELAVPPYGLMGVAKSALESLVRYLAVELGERRIRVNVISPGPIETLAALGEVLAFAHDAEATARQRGTLVSEAIAQMRESADGGDELMRATVAWREVQRGFARRCAIPDLVTKEDVAGCALFLASDHARLITGQVIHVDAGLSTTLLL